ncbi:MAG TPA: hypothetical protein VHA05_00355 [Candidatus Saccharimonadales bacterium]|nr:hypothetical protein [Candidatus Saccharimonadales bacterium]
MLIEAARAERPRAGKDHDRLEMLPDLGRFALFDGAAQAMASDIAAQVFADQHRQYDATTGFPLPLLNEVFEEIHKRIQEFQGEEAVVKALGDKAKNIVTTGTALGLRQLENSRGTVIREYAHAGDSSLWMFDYDAGQLIKLTEDEVIGNDSENCLPDIRNWLGSPEHELTQWLGTPLKTDHAAFALMSDGVTSFEAKRGKVDEPEIEEILRGDASPRSKADRLISASAVRDDASVIVVEFRADK